MSALVYRLLDKNEFAGYRNIWLECLKTYPDNFGPTYQEEANNKALKFAHIFSDNPTSDFVYGAFSGDELIGICGFISETMRKTKHRGQITQMYVKPDFGGMGIGTKLLQSAIENVFANSMTELITLTVVSANEKAIATYKKIGFIQYGILENCIKNDTGYIADLFMMLPRERYFIASSNLQ